MACLQRGWIVGVALSLALVTAFAARPSRRSSLPNFILIVAEDLDLRETLGSERTVKTPNLDRLAAEGMRFTQAYAGAPASPAGRAALMTGRHTGHSPVRSEIQVPLSSSDVTLAEVFRSVGYRNAAVGLWGLGWEGTSGHPNAQGFDEFMGYLDLGHGLEEQPGFLWRNQDAFSLAASSTGKRGSVASSWLWRAVTNFVRVSEDRPFFLYYAPNLPGLSTNMPTASEPALSAARQAREAKIKVLDDQIGLLVEDLRRRRLDSDTLLVFTSTPDRGSASRRRALHLGSANPAPSRADPLSEESLRVPLILWWPGHVKAGSTNRQAIALWDLLPTFAELAKATTPTGLDGRSFAAGLQGKPASTNVTRFYWEWHADESAVAGRIGPWKAIQRGQPARIALYNLDTDPDESHDVASSHPDLVAQFTRYFQELARPWSPPTDLAATAAGRAGNAAPTNTFRQQMRTNYLPSAPAPK